MAYCVNCRTGVVWMKDNYGFDVPIDVMPSEKGNHIIVSDSITVSMAVKIEDKETRERFRAKGFQFHFNHKEICLEAKFDGT